MDTQRNYKAKDVEMLITAATILESAIANKTFLQAKRSTWQDPFFQNFKAQIDQTISQYLGQDNAKELRQATQVVLTLQKAATRDLAELKVQLEEDFKASPAQKEELLNNLGFKTYYTGIKNKDQEALINLLYQFKSNLTPQTRTSIETAGTAPVLVDNILTYAETLKDANVFQEGKKGTRKELTK